MVRTTRRSTQSKKTKIELIFKLGGWKKIRRRQTTSISKYLVSSTRMNHSVHTVCLLHTFMYVCTNRTVCVLEGVAILEYTMYD